MSNHPSLDALRVLIVAGSLAFTGCTAGAPWNRAATPVLDSGQQVEVQLALGRTFEKQQQWNAARRVYAEILRSHPQQSAAAHRLAIVFDRQGDSTSAAKWFAQALQHDPENADIYCDMAYSLYRQDDLAGAEANFQQALALEPNHRRARNQLGLVLARTNRREEALAAFREAGCSSSEAHSNLAFALVVQRQTDQAADALQIAAQSAPGLPEHRRRLEAVASLITRVAAADAPSTDAAAVR